MVSGDPEEAHLRRRLRVYVMLLASMLLWGGTWPVGRVVAGGMSAWSAALLRFLLATAVLTPICLLSEGRGSLRVRPGLVPRLLLLGATGIFGYSTLFFWGLQTSPAGRAAVIVGCIPVCIALVSSLMARKLPRGGAVIGIVLSLAGVSVVIADGSPLRLLEESPRIGDLMILGCVLCWTSYTLLSRKAMQEISPLVAVTWSCILGSLMLLPFALVAGICGDIAAAGWREWIGLVYLGIAATSFAYYAYYSAIRRVGPVASGIFINLVPLFAVFLGCIFLDEPLHLPQVAGGAMVIGGVVITVKSSQ